MLEISNLHREINGFKIEDEIDFNRNESDYETQAGEKIVQLLINFIIRHENPFQTASKQNELHNFITKKIIGEEMSQESLSKKKLALKFTVNLNWKGLLKSLGRFQIPSIGLKSKDFIQFKSHQNRKA